MPTSLTSSLVEYAQEAFSKPIAPEVHHIAIQAIIDQLGLQVGGSEFPWSKGTHQYILEYTGTTGNSTVTRYGELISPVQAAFLNSCFAHAQDFDDSHQEAQTHPGSVVIPAAIAIGEHLESSGANVLKAIIIGMEVMLRLAHALCPACIEGGHHTPPTVGPFGAAIACGLLLGLDKAQLINALGICGSYSGGLVEYTLSGGSVKRIHTGLGARSGLEAALLAKNGLTGPNNIIEGDKGLFAVFGRGKAFQERLLDEIGHKYLLQTLMFKPFNCCYLIHPAIQLFLELCEQHNLKANDIKNVRVGLSDFSLSHAGTIKIPHDALGAQFSTSFTLALSLIQGAPGMLSYSDEALQNEHILSLASRIDTHRDEEVNAEFPKKNGCSMAITTLSDQLIHGKIREPKGCPENQLTPAEVKVKFMANTLPVMDEHAANELYEQLSHLHELEKINSLRSFSAPSSHHGTRIRI